MGTEEETSFPILVEFSTQPGFQKVSKSPKDLAKMSPEAVSAAMGSIKEMAQRVTKTVSEIAQGPSEFEVSFGLKFVAEVGAIIAKASGEAAVNVKLKWQKGK